MAAEENGHIRLVTPDVLKGLIMVLIVFVHLFILVPSIGESNRNIPLALQILYLGLMLFFIVSGYFYKPGRSTADNISKRAIQLLIPIVLGLLVLPTVLSAYLYVLGQNPDLGDLLNNYLRVFGSVHLFEPLYDSPAHDYGIMTVYNGYYFLQIMLVSFIIFYALIDRVREDLVRTVSLIVALVIIQAVLLVTVDLVLPFWLNLVPISTAFMFLGQLMSRINLIGWMETYPVKVRSFWISVLVSVIALISLCVVFPPDTGFDLYKFGDHGALSVFPYFIEAGVAAYLFLIIASFIAKIPIVSRLLIVVGRHTVAVICLHIFVIKLLISPFHQLVPNAVFPKLPMADAILAGLATLVIVVTIAEYLTRYLSDRFSVRN